MGGGGRIPGSRCQGFVSRWPTYPTHCRQPSLDEDNDEDDADNNDDDNDDDDDDDHDDCGQPT